MARRLEYTLATRVDPVLASQLQLGLLEMPGVSRVEIDLLERRVTALVSDDLAPDDFAGYLVRLGFPPEYQRGAFYIQPLGSVFMSFEIRSLFAKLPGVKSVKVNPISGLFFIKYDRNRFAASRIKEILLARGMSATETGALELLHRQKSSRQRKLLINALIALVLSAGVFAAEFFGKSRVAGLASGVALFWPGWMLWLHALRHIGAGRLDRNLPAVLAGLVFLVHGFWALFSGQTPYFIVPAAVVALLLLWELALSILSRSVFSTIERMMSGVARWARVERGGRVMEVPADEIDRGETIHVAGGERIPVDGVVLDGQARTPEGIVSAGSFVRMSTPILSGEVRLAASSRYGNCFHMRQILVVEEALASGSNSRVFLALMILVCIATFASPALAWFAGPTAFALAAIPLIQAICLAADWHRIAGVQKALKHGIVFRTAQRLHHLRRANLLLVPLGSLLGPYELESVDGDGDLREVAGALVRGLCAKPARSFRETALVASGRQHMRGMGTAGTVRGVDWRFGSCRFVRAPQHDPGAEKSGKYTLFIEGEGRAATFVFRREAREGVDRLVRAFKNRVLVTSASRDTADFWASRLGITETYPESVPDGKIQVMGSLVRKKKRVLYLEDEPLCHEMLARAFWSMTLAEDYLDLESGDTIVLGGNIRMATRAMRIASRSNLAKLAGFTLALGALAGLVAAWWFGFLPPGLLLAVAFPLLFLVALI